MACAQRRCYDRCMLVSQPAHHCMSCQHSARAMPVCTPQSLQIQGGNFASTLPAIPVQKKDCQAVADDFAVYFSVVATMAKPCLPAKCIVQIGKEHACRRLPSWQCQQIAGNLLPKLCHTLPSLSSRQNRWQNVCWTICQLLPNCAGMFCMIYNLQLGHC